MSKSLTTLTFEGNNLNDAAKGGIRVAWGNRGGKLEL